MSPPDNFVVFILTHGRPDRVKTYATLRRQGYTGPIVLVVDNLDKSLGEYRQRYPDEVEVFDKVAMAEKTDAGDNFPGLGSVVFARNACFDIAERLGYMSFVELDDDYSNFSFRFNGRLEFQSKAVLDLNRVFVAMVKFHRASKCHSLAFMQNGDFIGGDLGSPHSRAIMLRRKCMNSFFCSVDRRFSFFGKLNDDVNTYVRQGMTGKLLFSVNQVALSQSQTQETPGGLTPLYLEAGTYVKSFFTVMYAPSCAKVSAIGRVYAPRLHHAIAWRNAVPKIVREAPTT